MDLQSIIIALIAAAGGGTLSTIATLLVTRKEAARKLFAEATLAESDAARVVVEIWEKTGRYMESRIAALEAEVVDLRAKRTDREERIAAMEGELRELRMERKDNLNTIKAQQNRNAEQNNVIASLRAGMESKNIEFATLIEAKNCEIANLNNEIATLNAEIADLTSRVRVLEQNRENRASP